MSRTKSKGPVMQIGSGKLLRWLVAFAATLLAAAIIFGKPSVPPARPRAFCPPVQRGSHAPLRPDVPGTIDGAKHPELISDDLAYKMMLLSLIVPENPTDLQNARQKAQMRMLKLSPIDEAALLALVSEFRDHLKGWKDQAAEIHKRAPVPLRGTPEWQSLSDIQQQKDKLVTDTAASFVAKLSMDGTAKLQARLPEVKQGIKCVPSSSAIGY